MPSKEEVVEALREVEDPELGMDIVELGLFYDAEIEGTKVKAPVTGLRLKTASALSSSADV